MYHSNLLVKGKLLSTPQQHVTNTTVLTHGLRIASARPATIGDLSLLLALVPFFGAPHLLHCPKYYCELSSVHRGVVCTVASVVPASSRATCRVDTVKGRAGRATRTVLDKEEIGKSGGSRSKIQ